MVNAHSIVYTTLILSFISFYGEAATQMWSTCATSVTTSYSIPPAGGAYEAIGCIYPSSFVYIADSEDRTTEASVVIRGGAVGATALSGIGLTFASSDATALLMGPLHLSLRDIVFGKGAGIKVAGSIPPSSTIIIANNSLYIVKINTVLNSAFAAAILVGVPSSSQTLTSNTHFAIVNNTIRGTLTLIQGAYAIYVTGSSISLNGGSSFAVKDNAAKDFSATSSVYVIYLSISNVTVSNVSSLAITNNEAFNCSNTGSLNLVVVNTLTIIVDGQSLVRASGNYFKQSTITSIYSNANFQVVTFSGTSLSIKLTNGSSVHVVDNALLSSTMVTGGAAYGIYWTSLDWAVTVSDCSDLQIAHNRINNFTGPKIYVAYLSLSTSTTFLLSNNSSIMIDGNSIENSIGSTAVTVVRLGLGGVYSSNYFQITGRSRFSVSGNTISNSSVQTIGTAIAFHFYIAYGFVFIVDGSSAIAFNQNAIQGSSVSGEATAMYISPAVYSTTATVLITISNKSTFSVDGNEVSLSMCTSSAQAVNWFIDQTNNVPNTVFITIGNGSSFSSNNNSVIGVSAWGYVSAVQWPIVGSLTVTIAGRSVMSFDENTALSVNASNIYAVYLSPQGTAKSVITASDSNMSFSNNAIMNCTAFAAAIASYTSAKTISFQIKDGAVLRYFKNNIIRSQVGGMAINNYISVTSLYSIEAGNHSIVSVEANEILNVPNATSLGNFNITSVGSTGSFVVTLTFSNSSSLVTKDNIIMFASDAVNTVASSVASFWVYATTSLGITLNDWSIIDIVGNTICGAAANAVYGAYWQSENEMSIWLLGYSALSFRSQFINRTSSTGTISLAWFTSKTTLTLKATAGALSIANSTIFNTSAVAFYGLYMSPLTAQLTNAQIDVSWLTLKSFVVYASVSLVSLLFAISATSFQCIATNVSLTSNALFIAGDATSVHLCVLTVYQPQLLSSKFVLSNNTATCAANKSTAMSAISVLPVSSATVISFTANNGSAILIDLTTFVSADGAVLGAVSFVNFSVSMSLGLMSSVIATHNNAYLCTLSTAALMTFTKTVILATQSLLSVAQNYFNLERATEGCMPPILLLISVQSDLKGNNTLLVSENSIVVNAPSSASVPSCPWLNITGYSDATTISQNTITSSVPLYIASSSTTVQAKCQMVVSDNHVSFGSNFPVTGQFFNTTALVLAANARLIMERNSIFGPYIDHNAYLMMNTAKFTTVATAAVLACGNSIFGIKDFTPKRRFMPGTLAAYVSLCTRSVTLELKTSKSSLLSVSTTRAHSLSTSLATSQSAFMTRSLSAPPSSTLSQSSSFEPRPSPTQSWANSLTTPWPPSQSDASQSHATDKMTGSLTILPTVSLIPSQTFEANDASIAPSATTSDVMNATQSQQTKEISSSIINSHKISKTVELPVTFSEGIPTRTVSVTTVPPTNDTTLTTDSSLTSHVESSNLTEIPTNDSATTSTTDTATSSTAAPSSSSPQPATTHPEATNVSTPSDSPTELTLTLTTSDMSNDTTSTLTSVSAITDITTLANTSAPQPTVPLCPSPSLTYPTGNVATASLQASGLTLQLSLPRSDPTILWASSVNSSYLSLVGLEDAITFDSAKLNCTVLSPYLLQCQLSALPSFSIPGALQQQQIRVVVRPLIFETLCMTDGADSAIEVGVVTIQQRGAVPLSAAVANILTVAVASGPVLLALVGDPTNVELQAMVALFSAEGCTTVDEREATKVAKYISLSPFVDLGPEEVVVAHIAIIVAVAIIQIASAGGLYALKRTSPDGPDTFRGALHRLMFPHITFVVAGILYMGLIQYSFKVLLVDDDTGSKKGIGTVGLIVAIGIIVCQVVVVAFRSSIGATYQLVTQIPDATVGGCVKTLACYRYPAIRSWLWPRGTYSPLHIRRAYSAILFSMTPTRVTLAPYPLVMCFGLALLLNVGAQADGSDGPFGCTYRWSAIAAWFGLFAILLFALSPHRAIASSHITAVAYLILLTVATLSAVGGLFDAKAAMAILLLLLGILRSVHTLLYVLLLDSREEEHAMKKKTIYFGREMVIDESVRDECKRTADIVDYEDELGGIISPHKVVLRSPEIELFNSEDDEDSGRLHVKREGVLPTAAVSRRPIPKSYSSSNTSSEDSNFNMHEKRPKGSAEVQKSAESISKDYTSDFTSNDTLNVLEVSERGIVNLQPLPSHEMDDSEDLLDSSEEELTNNTQKREAMTEDDNNHSSLEVDDEDFLF